MLHYNATLCRAFFFYRYNANKLEVPYYIDWWMLELTSLDGWLKRFNDVRQSCRQRMVDKPFHWYKLQLLSLGFTMKTMKFHLMQVRVDIAGWLTETFHWHRLELSLLDGWLKCLIDAGGDCFLLCIWMCHRVTFLAFCGPFLFGAV